MVRGELKLETNIPSQLIHAKWKGGLINKGGVMSSMVNALYGLGQVLISLLCTMNITIASQTKWCKKVSWNIHTMLKRPRENTGC